LLIEPTGLLVQQLVFHGQFANFGLQTLDKIVSRVVLIGMGLEGRSTRGQELLSPHAEGGSRDTELPSEGLEVFAAKQADNSLPFALG
jgi:hypothetical protein